MFEELKNSKTKTAFEELLERMANNFPELEIQYHEDFKFNPQGTIYIQHLEYLDFDRKLDLVHMVDFYNESNKPAFHKPILLKSGKPSNAI